MTKFIGIGGVDRDGYSSGQMLFRSSGWMTAKPGNFSDQLVHGTDFKKSRGTGKEVRALTTMFGTESEYPRVNTLAWSPRPA